MRATAVILLVFSFGLLGGLGAVERGQGVIVVACQAGYPPFEFVREDGVVDGMQVELLRWIATGAGLGIEFRPMPFADAQAEVLAGRAQVISSLFYSVERAKRFAFTAETWEMPASIFVPEAETRITGVADLVGRRVAIQAGDYAIDWLGRHGIEVVLVETPSFADALSAVLHGQADAAIADEPIALHHLVATRNAGRLRIVGESLYVGSNRIGVTSLDPSLLTVLEEGLANAKQSGVMSAIAARWLGRPMVVNRTSTRLLPTLAIIGLILIGVAATVIAWNLRLRSAVAVATSRLAEREIELRHAHAMEAVGRLAGGIAHDFNNMLAGILGYAEILVRRLREQPELRRHAERIVGAATRAADLTRSLSAISRRAGRVTQAVDVHELVRDTVALFIHGLDPRIIISTDFRAMRSWVQGDGAQLQSAILNLLVNARDALPDGGRIAVSTVDEDHEGDAVVALRVADTGTGIDPAVADRLFQPFVTTKPAGVGSGLGLAAVWSCVHDHGGTVLVSSQAGKGSVFTVLLPAAATPTGRSQPIEDTSGPGPSWRGLALVVDDEATLRSLAVEALGDLGFEVLEAGDGDEALAMAETNPGLSLVLLDLIMPRRTGAECFQLLRKLRPALPIVICTGHGGEADLDQLLANGASGILRKPWRLDQLSAAVLEAMRSSDERRVSPAGP